MRIEILLEAHGEVDAVNDFYKKFQAFLKRQAAVGVASQHVIAKANHDKVKSVQTALTEFR